MRKPVPIILFYFLLVLTLSCNTSYRAQHLQFTDYRINPSMAKDQAMLSVIQPYSDSINKTMNDIIGIADKPLEKLSPSGTLGNFMVDAELAMAQKKFNTPVDLAFINYGGIRLPQISSGPVTRGKIFELMPFDNMVVLQRLKGSVLQDFLNLVASRGGWPVAGMTMQVKDKKAVNILIGGKPLDPNATYVIAISDFIANGGDNADMLRTIAQENLGYPLRDALFDYISWLKSQGKNIVADESIRITNAE